MTPAERIIVALDFDSGKEALRLVEQLRGRVGLFKVGSQLFTAEGPNLVRAIVQSGEKVFLDLKFHDIPNTVVKAVSVAQSLGVSMLTLHASGGLKMMSAVTEVFKTRGRETPRPVTLAVTVLTSMAGSDLEQVGCTSGVSDQVLRLAELVRQAGLDGVVASPEELPVLRQRFGTSLQLVIPGIRPLGSAPGDQNRIATPGAALRSGADYLVIGRPITASQDPPGSLARILDEMESG